MFIFEQWRVKANQGENGVQQDNSDQESHPTPWQLDPNIAPEAVLRLPVRHPAKKLAMNPHANAGKLNSRIWHLGPPAAKQFPSG